MYSEQQKGPMVAPGKYTVRLTVDGHAYTQPLEVLIDPRTSASESEIASSVKMQLRIRDDISSVADMVNHLEWMRKQLNDIEKMLTSEKAKPELLKSVQAFDQKLQSVEYTMLSKALAPSDDKYFVSAYKLYFNLLWLNAEVGPGAGDVAGGTDFGPTDAEVEVLGQIEKEMAAAKSEYNSLMQTDVPAFNKTLTEHGALPLSPAVQGETKASAEESPKDDND
jgi:hypothetical protein